MAIRSFLREKTGAGLGILIKVWRVVWLISA